MGRSLPLTVAVLVLILMPAPLVLSASVGPQVLRYITRARPGRIFLRSALKGAWRGFKDYIKSLPGGQETDDGNDDNSADTAGRFIFNLSVGTSTPQNIPGVLDITSQLVWSQCAPCTACVPPPAPSFQPKRSATFSRLPCRSQTCQRVVVNETCPAANATPTDDYCKYFTSYDDDTNTTGYLANDTFTFDSTQVPGMVFGCSVASVGDFFGASGVFGFSKGPLSLVSQLHLSWFSYFWASDDSGRDSFIQLGDDKVTPTPTSRSTPLLNSSLYPDLYVVKITGIKVGDKLQRDIPAGTFDLRANGSGGVFLSTTVPVTFLEEAACNVVRNSLASGIKAQPVNGSALGLDLCYTIKSMAKLKVPKLALVFDGNDAVMNLKRSNYFFRDNTTGLDCLSILPSRGLSLLGSLLQTDRNMTYDIANAQLIFEPVPAAAPPVHSMASSLLMALPLAVWMVLL